MASTRRIGILTGGGDVPGLNSVIKSVVYRSTALGYEVLGIRRGWEGLTHLRPGSELDSEYVRPLDRVNTRTIDRTGGTWLHTLTTPLRCRLSSKQGSMTRFFALLPRTVVWVAAGCFAAFVPVLASAATCQPER